MRFLPFLSALVFTTVLSGLPAFAQAQSGAQPGAQVSTKPQTLDDMFIELRRAKSEAAAGGVAERIKERWDNSGSATVDLLMQWAGEAMDRKDWAAAQDFLDQVVVLKPDFAEGWNRRATMHYLAGNFPKSMADIERTLALEPRHFGALSGMAIIFLEIGKKEPALAAYKRVLEIYPQMREAQKQVGDLEDELTGSRI
ncbi:MAG: tetratricopeptide repeat protein [Rhizobiaceae bacterium]